MIINQIFYFQNFSLRPIVLGLLWISWRAIGQEKWRKWKYYISMRSKIFIFFTSLDLLPFMRFTIGPKQWVWERSCENRIFGLWSYATLLKNTVLSMTHQLVAITEYLFSPIISLKWTQVTSCTGKEKWVEHLDPSPPMTEHIVFYKSKDLWGIWDMYTWVIILFAFMNQIF